MDLDGDSYLSLVNPPVRLVRLTLVFDADPPVQARHLARLTSELEEEFDVVSEAPPRQISFTADDETLSLEGPTWPLPYTTFRDANGGISFQGDSFDIVWTAKPSESGSYVGFRELHANLVRRFHGFCKHLEAAGLTVNVKEAECFYQNELPDISAQSLVQGVATEWAGTFDPAGVSLESPQYMGLRLRHNEEPAEGATGGTASMVMVDCNPDQVPRMSLIVQSSKLQDGWESALTGAHNQLIDMFMRYTTPHMRKNWGDSK